METVSEDKAEQRKMVETNAIWENITISGFIRKSEGSINSEEVSNDHGAKGT